MKNKSKDFKVNYKNAEHNIYGFLNNHPGGTNYLNPYQNKEINERMLETRHSKAAYYLLREYRSTNHNQHSATNNHHDPEDLENLVDWNKPMLSQVANLGAKYNEWVGLPVDRKLRLFHSTFLENLTITPWYVVPLIWIPIIIVCIFNGGRKYVQITKDTTPFLPIAFYLVAGVVIWTLIEYSLHRWVFHMEPSGKSKLMICFHFAIHGLHHKVPFDSRRLVFPPFPAAVLAYAIYQIIRIALPESVSILVIAGGLIGYVVYDMIHFYLHYGSPHENSYFYYLKRYHNQHHFVHHNSGNDFFNLKTKSHVITFNKKHACTRSLSISGTEISS